MEKSRIAFIDAVRMQRLGSLCASRAWSAGLARPALSVLSLRCAASRASSAASTHINDAVNKVRHLYTTALVTPAAAAASCLP